MKLSQTQRVLRQLELGNSIGSIWGILQDPPILRVASRIDELIKDGHKIVTIKKKRQDGSWSPTCEYTLLKHFDKKRHRRFFDGGN